ncbi:MAG: DUF3099 domain-containing protein [Actinomycetes bacterium]
MRVQLRRKPSDSSVHLVTEARTSRYDDIAARQRQYLIRMFIRTIAVVVAFFVPLPVWGRVLAIAVGLVLPMISVTSANAGPLPEPGMDRYDQRALPSGIDVPSTPESDGQTVIDREPGSRASS